MKIDAFIAVSPKVILNKLHALGIHGNKAASGELVRTQRALWLLKEAHDLARWMCVRYGKAKANQLPTFQKPTIPGAVEERERRQILEKLVAQEVQMKTLLSELEEACSKTSAAQKEATDLKQLACSTQATVDELHFSEAESRSRLIDSVLASVGRDIAEDTKSTTQVGKEVEVDGQPTAIGIGYADYVLWDDTGNPLAVIGAKKTAIDAEHGRHQAKLYADIIEKRYGHRPVSVYTNNFDIWNWDDTQQLPPRKLFGFFSKGSLQHLANYKRHQKSHSTLSKSILR